MTALGALLAFVGAAVAGLVVVPVIAKLAARFGAVDAPDGTRKNQTEAVPLGGGVAIALAAGVGLIAAVLFGAPHGLVPLAGYWNTAIPSAVVLIIVGLIDDTIGLTGIYKLIGQVLAASLLAAAGFHFEGFSLFGGYVALGDLGIPFSIFFTLGAINAFNLIDGADGLAASIGAVVCMTLGIIASLQGATVAAIASFALSGALVGFLKYNAPPARVYLGDTGSMLIGWLVAAVAIRCSIKHSAAVALAVPVAICAIPILDAAAAMVRRITTGQSVFTADRGHLHHALLLRGWTVGQTAALAAGMTAITCTGAVLSYITGQEAFALAATAGVVLALVAARVFGHAELALLNSQVRSIARGAMNRMRPLPSDSAASTDQAIQIQGSRQWSVLWTALREAAEGHNLGSLKLNVNIPHLHESFYATWKASEGAGAEDAWRMVLPLTYGSRSIGRLLIAGRVGGNKLVEMQHMLDFLEPLEAEMARLVEEAEADLAVNGSPTRLGAPRRRTGAEPIAAATDYY